MDGTRSYLFSGLNDAELFGSGGAPLNGSCGATGPGRADHPRLGFGINGIEPRQRALPLGRLRGACPGIGPAPSTRSRTRTTTPISASPVQTCRAAWNALDLTEVDGVITIDVAAVAAVLNATGPVSTQAFGEVTADNVIRTLLVDAYRDYPDWPVESNSGSAGRQRRTPVGVIDGLRDPRTALRAARALWDVIPGRHVQAYMADPALQSVVSALGADGALSEPSGDVLGVFLQSGPSKLAIFQQQRIERRVQIAADGSAAGPPAGHVHERGARGPCRGCQAYRGYLALTYRQRVAFRIPESASGPDRRRRRRPRTRAARCHRALPGLSRCTGPLAGAGHRATRPERHRGRYRLHRGDVRRPRRP